MEVFLNHSFFLRALLAASILGPMLGAIGVFVVSHRLAFLSQAVSQSALLGVALAILCGGTPESAYLGVIAVCGSVAILITYLTHNTNAHQDTVTGVSLALSLALGMLSLIWVTKHFNIHQIEGVLFGSIITINEQDTLILLVGALVFWFFYIRYFNRFLLTAVNDGIISASGENPFFLRHALAFCIAFLIALSLKLLGALLVLVLTIVPAAAAQRLSPSARGAFWNSIFLATVSAVIGLLASTMYSLPAGAIISFTACAFYGVVIIWKMISP